MGAGLLLFGLGAAVVGLVFLGRQATAHPLCFYGDKATNTEAEMTFCPQQEEGACCNEQEERSAFDLYHNASTEALTGDCAKYYKEVSCGPCNPYSGHLYERLGRELGAGDGLTMKGEFCSKLVEACTGQTAFPTYEGLSYCDKHVGGSDQLWSYPIDPEVLTFGSVGLVDAFPNLPDEELPRDLIAMRMTPAGDEWWLGGQRGEIKKVDAGDPTSASIVVDLSSGMELLKQFEEGLLDFAFSPAFESNNFFYVSYTIKDKEGSKNRLSRFTYFDDDSIGTKSSVDIVITSEVKATSFHSAGWVGFKPSDYQDTSEAFHDIYWAIGDGGPQADPYGTGADLSNLLATIVRVSVPAGTEETGYKVPDGNRKGGRGEICANGLRNPYRCSFDSATNELYCGDVGHTKVEEIDLIECGKDYGWSRFEGSRCFDGSQDQYGDCDSANRRGFTFPIFEYCQHDYKSTDVGEAKYTDDKDICGTHPVVGNAVIGGYVYRGQRFSDVLDGALVFADYQKRNIFFIKKDGDEWTPGSIVCDGTAQVISFAEDNDGEQYVITSERKAYQLPCGDLCSVTCLDQDPNELSIISLGCFRDVTYNRALDLVRSPECGTGETIMSPKICASYCATIEGAVYSGVEYASECYCGAEDAEYDRHDVLDPTSCSASCIGNLDQKCGGTHAIEVFIFERVFSPTPVPTPIPTPVPTPVPTTVPTTVPTMIPTTVPTTVRPSTLDTNTYAYLGCYGDSKTFRVLSGSFTTSNQMTAEVCSRFCQDSEFFGTQFSSECFCSYVGDVYDAFGEASCDKICTGDAYEVCGGKGAISVYQNELIAGTGTGTASSAADSSYTLVGCFYDSKDSRLLEFDFTSGPSMTTEFCASFCEGSEYFGTEFGEECFCGSPADPLGDDTATNCVRPCSGDPSEICGGYAAINIYRYNDDPVEAPLAGSYIGCYLDSRGNRVMTNVMVDLGMTSEVCAYHCAGYTYYGTQYGNQCWCSNTNAFESLGTSTACLMACAGDPKAICGGYNALSVYEK